MRFGRDSQGEKGRISISTAERYHVMRRESRPSNPESRISHNEVNGQKSECELELNEDCMVV